MPRTTAVLYVEILQTVGTVKGEDFISGESCLTRWG